MAVEFLQVVAKQSEQLFKDVLANRCNAISAFPSLLNKRDSIGAAFSPDQMSRNAVTSSPITAVPVTIVHRMPNKRKTVPNPNENNQLGRIPLQTPIIPIALPLSNSTTVTLENSPRKKFTPVINKVSGSPPLRHISEAPAIPQNVEIRPVVTGNAQTMGHGMPLGSIIKDVDLLKLILKALKWPCNSQTLDIQIQRLKNTNFNDIIVDPNLLQDTDLIQILGPLLNPLPVTMQQQTYHITIPPETLDVPPTTMSYKLPAETSVQIITVPPAAEKETEQSHERKHRDHRSSSKRHIKHSVIRKKFENPPPVIVLSDSDDERSTTMRKTAAAASDEIQLDPTLYPATGENSNSNEEMLATLNRQREAMMRMHRSKRKQSLAAAKNVEMVDDIMIVDEGYHMEIEEPFPEVVLVKKNRDSSTSQSKHAKSSSASRSIVKPNLSTSIKVPQRSAELPNRSENPPLSSSSSSSSRGFVKARDANGLPALKKVKVFSSAPNFVQMKETVKIGGYTSKTTTLADADSTTKIVMKDSKVPKSAKSNLSFEGKFSKAKNSTGDVQIPPSSSSGKDQKEDDSVVVGQLEENCVEGEKQSSAVARAKAKKKKEYRLLGTFNISDDEMEPLPAETTPPVAVEKQLPTKKTKETIAEPSVEKESPIETSNEPKIKESDSLAESVAEPKEAGNIELPSVDIKSEEQEEIKVKKEDLEYEF